MAEKAGILNWVKPECGPQRHGPKAMAYARLHDVI